MYREQSMTEAAANVTKITISLAELAKSFALKDRKFDYFHGKIFSFIPPQTDQAGLHPVPKTPS